MIDHRKTACNPPVNPLVATRKITDSCFYLSINSIKESAKA